MPHDPGTVALSVMIAHTVPQVDSCLFPTLARSALRIGKLNASFHCLQLYGWPRKRVKRAVYTENSPRSMTIRTLHRPESLYDSKQKIDKVHARFPHKRGSYAGR